MREFDYNEDEVVGYVDFLQGSLNAKIEVVGYRHWRDGFIPLDNNVILKTFSPKGKVFAHYFAERHYETKGHLVCVRVIPNEKIGEGLDDFVWNKSGNVFEFGTKVIKLEGCFSANGQHNYTILQENGLLDLDKDKYVSSGGYIYLIKTEQKERLIPYWKESSLNTITVKGKTFIIPNNTEEDGKIDITTDEQLIDWYFKNVLKKNWSDIFEQKTFRNVEPILRNAINVSKGLDKIIVESRINRLSKITQSLELSFDDLKELKELPWLGYSIEQSIENHKDKYFEEIKKEKAQELESIKERYDMEILEAKEHAEKEKRNFNRQIEKIEETYQNRLEEYEKLIQDKNQKINVLNETYQTKTDELVTIKDSIKRLEEKKEAIISDYSIIKEVLGSHSTKTKTGDFSFPMEEISFSGNQIPVYQAFIKSLENILKINSIDYKHVLDLGNQIAAFKILLVPDVAIAKVIITASMKCRYSVEYVNATWKSFSDLWENGLGDIMNKCQVNKDLMHFLILQNINLNYLPNYMMPLIDLESGLLSRIPGTDYPFPSNLRIICTITKDEVIPLSADCVQYIGCISKSIGKERYGKIVAPEVSNLGYLTPQMLANAFGNIKEAPNFYEDYIDE